MSKKPIIPIAPKGAFFREGKWHHGKKWMPAMYVTYFGIIQELANKHGYALCVHGSVVRDFDLIAVPFDQKVSTHEELLTAIRQAIGPVDDLHDLFSLVGHEPHGRTCYTIQCGGGGYFDLSFTPTVEQLKAQMKADRRKSREVKRFIKEMDVEREKCIDRIKSQDEL